jgi:hypothetical protein
MASGPESHQRRDFSRRICSSHRYWLWALLCRWRKAARVDELDPSVSGTHIADSFADPCLTRPTNKAAYSTQTSSLTSQGRHHRSSSTIVATSDNFHARGLPREKDKLWRGRLVTRRSCSVFDAFTLHRWSMTGFTACILNTYWRSNPMVAIFLSRPPIGDNVFQSIPRRSRTES